MTQIIQGNAGVDWGAFDGSNRAIIGDRVFHYGVIPACDVLQARVDSAEWVYPEWDNEFYDAADVCDVCGKTFAKHQKVKRHEFVNESAVESFNDSAEVSGFVFENGEYAAFQDGDDSDIFVTRSAFYTFSAFCSPCAPGAGYLRDARGAEDGVMTFCFDHSWYDDGIAPYGVWRVDNGTLVIPDNPHAGMLRFELRDDFADWVSKWREFNAAIAGYTERWGTKQETSAARAYVDAIEYAFHAGGYDAVVALGDFAQWVNSLA